MSDKENFITVPMNKLVNDNIENYYNHITDPTQVVSVLSKKIFCNNDCYNYVGIECDDSMEIADTFCMLVEILLHGVNILSHNTKKIFDIDDNDLDLMTKIKSKFINTQFKINFEIADSDKKDYYIKIINQQQELDDPQKWYVSGHELIYNNNFELEKNTRLDDYYVVFETSDSLFYYVNFSFNFNY